jgi:dTDP-glucose pyrophosphorylase
VTRTAIIPIAGNSSRFRPFTSRPKWALQFGDKTILDWSVQSLLEGNPEIEEFIFVVKRKDLSEFENSLSLLAGRKVETVVVESTPNGQASSVAIALRELEVSNEITVWNGDTHLVSGWSRGHAFAGNGLVLADLEGDHWSFAALSGGLVTRTAEKVRISPHASVGLYNFESAGVYLDAFAKFHAQGEVYVAPLFNSIAMGGRFVSPHFIRREYFLPLGTPAEVLSSAAKLGVSAPKELLG